MEIKDIKTYMKENGVTQIELAEKSGIPLQTLRKIFSGRTQYPRLDTVQAIEQALGLSPPSTIEREPGGIELSETEKRLLDAFNELTPSMQEYFVSTVEATAKAEAEKMKNLKRG